ncbi:MAG: ribonuclease P protein component [Clostridia bacterium]|nr:ribonuclease P protein component [Clostridia bacterium]
MKYYRIKKNTEFQKIFAKAKRGFSSSLTILFYPSERFRMGVCVGKKHGGSVTRNRVKRLLREIFRLHADRLEKGYAYVLVPKAEKNEEDYSYKKFEKDFLYVVKKQKLLSEENL